MKHFKKILYAFCLCLVLTLTLGCSTFTRKAQAAEGGSFYLTASISSKTLIEPVAVSYKEGATIREALKASDYAFGNIDQFYITDIEGVSGNFNIYYDGGGYDLDAPASSITGILFSERQDLSTADFNLMLKLAAFRQMEGNVGNYPAAVTAYSAGLAALRESGQDASTLSDNLQNAINEYNALFDGPKYTVNVTAVQGSDTLTDPVITLTDTYGNEYTNTGKSISVIAGSYTFVISDGKISTTEGTIQVSKDTSLSVTLPAGQWFQDLKLLDREKTTGISEEDASFTEELAAASMKSSLDLDKGNATFFIRDTADNNTCLLYAVQGDVPTEDVRLKYSYYNESLKKIYTPTDSAVISWESLKETVSGLVSAGEDGKDLTLWAQYTGEDGYVQKQTINCRIERIPTLSSLTVTAEGTTLPLEFDAQTGSYALSTVSDNVDIAAQGYLDSYTVTGTGHFSLDSSKTQNSFEVSVKNDSGYTNTYTIKIEQVDSVPVTLSCPTGCTLKVYNNAGSEAVPVDGTYHLIAGETYYYICGKQDRYFTKASFTAASGLAVTAQAPEVLDAITAFRLYDASNAKSRKQFTVDQDFDPAVSSYLYTLLDSNSIAYAQADAADGYTVTMNYTNQQTTSASYGSLRTTTITAAVSDTATANVCSYMLVAGGRTQTAELTASKVSDDGVTYYQSYALTFRKSLQLSALSAKDSYGTVIFYDAEGNKISFNRSVKDYYVTVDRTTEELDVSGTFYKTDGYSALAGGTKTTDLSDLQFSLDPSKDTEDVTIELLHEDANAVSSIYTIHVKKTDPVEITFHTTPENANVYVVDNTTDRHISKTDGVYRLTPGVSYTYTVTLKSYVAQSVSDYIAPDTAATITVELTKAAENTALQDYSAAWPSYRADENNNGVVNTPTPTSAESSTLYWATQLGSGYGSDACGCPILADGYLYTYAGSKIYKVDTISGEVVASGDMDHSSSFAINSPTYAEGMIFVGLSNGCIQAFNADTLESVWIYHDPLKGQPNCPIAYHDGYIYTGFWLGETMRANCVALSVTDEDPDNTMEEKEATWRYGHDGGFYWAGAYVSDNFVLIGTDDGSSGYLTGHADILSLDPLSGDLIDSYSLKETGDQRSSITFVPDEDGSGAGYGYFTTKGGYFYQIRVNKDGTFSDNPVKALKLDNYASDDNTPGMSTSTPTIYNGRAYIGVCGTSQFGSYSGHNITVIDLKHWTIAYSVKTQGYPQTSGLLSTAYEEDTGDVYVYFFDNYTPGKLRMLTDHAGQTEAKITSVESYTSKTGTTDYTTAYNLFTPYDAQAQYVICSPITDEYGTLYFKNDSAYLMAFGANITKLEITSEPDTMEYDVGDTFDGTGMTVTATYANGTTRDVTKYVTWSTDPLTADDTEFTIEFPYTMYHNEDGNAGVEVEHPFVTLSLTINGVEAGAPTFTWTETEEGMTAQAVFAAADTTSGEEETYDCEVSSKVTREADCTTKGILTYTAKVTYNGKEYSKRKKVYQDALGHDYVEQPGQNPTCTENGYSAYQKCSRCGDVIDYEELKATGHTWSEQGTVTREATETQTGIMRYTCTVCGATKEEVIPVKEHKHVSETVSATAATWTKAGKTKGTRCSICKEVLSGCKTVAKAGTPTLSTKVYTYNGKAKCPTVKLTGLKKGTDYTVTYSGNKKVGTATATIKLKGNYSGTKTLKFTIKPAGTKLTKLTASSKAFTAKWTKKSAQVTGYQLRYSRYASMKNAKTTTVTSYKTTSKKVKKLTKKKYYYVQIRTYKTVSGKKYYSGWSAKKKVKVK